MKKKQNTVVAHVRGSQVRCQTPWETPHDYKNLVCKMSDTEYPPPPAII